MSAADGDPTGPPSQRAKSRSGAAPDRSERKGRESRLAGLRPVSRSIGSRCLHPFGCKHDALRASIPTAWRHDPGSRNTPRMGYNKFVIIPRSGDSHRSPLEGKKTSPPAGGGSGTGAKCPRSRKPLTALPGIEK